MAFGSYSQDAAKYGPLLDLAEIYTQPVAVLYVRQPHQIWLLMPIAVPPGLEPTFGLGKPLCQASP